MAKDIVVFLSDQHRADFVSWENDLVRTPSLDRIKKEGACFNAAYTSSPLCVPARCSMLSTLLPAKTGIYTNEGCMNETLPTFLHSLALSGYETVLCGRMHFMGKDQRHGFTKRIAPDITNIYWGANREFREELGPFASSLGEKGCLSFIGKGESPIAMYDEMVVNTALEYLSQKHDKPQCMIIGTYAPHFSYVAPPELYDYYLDRIEEKEEQKTDYVPLKHKVQECPAETLKKAKAAYYAMVTNMDTLIGKTYDAFQTYLKNNNREGVFAYLSDHGDMLGEKGLFAKRSFYDASARIPMIFTGTGILKDKEINSPVSIMDLGPTLIDIANSEKMLETDGVSLLPALEDGVEDDERIVISDVADYNDGTVFIGRMARYKDKKVICYNNDAPSLYYDLKNDKNEEECLPQDAVFKEIKQRAFSDWNTDALEKEFMVNHKRHEILCRWGALFDSEPVKERWHLPSSVKNSKID